MVQGVQRLLMIAYGAANRAHLFDGRRRRAAFEALYAGYKGLLETRYLPAIRRDVQPGTIVVDVGANIGFFTRRLADWVGPTGHVIAIEPEANTFERLRARLVALGLAERVALVHAAAVEKSGGSVTLAVDPVHPGGHHLAAEGVPVPCVSVDQLVAERPTRRVSFIKIDVQGAELRVLEGSVKTIDRWRPVLLVELEESSLRAQGTSARAVIDFLWVRGYRGRLISMKGATAYSDAEMLLQACLRHPYIDVLFEHSVDRA